MLKGQYVTVDLVKGSKNEYIIRDINGITVGRVFIIELSDKDRYCSLRIKFYKSGMSSYELLKESLETFLRSLFKNMNVYKVNVIADEEINIMAFTDLGFKLEGVISDSVISNSDRKDEILFGTDFDVFKNGHRQRELEIRGSNIDVSVLTPNDAEDVFKYYVKNKEYLKPFEPEREESFYTLPIQKRNLIESYKQFLNGDSVNFGIYKNEGLIGKIQISNIVMGVFKNAFVGYSIDEDEQGKGYMKEALRLVCKYAFNEVGVHRLEASTLVDNEKSQRVLRACGFKELGISKKYLFINGQWRDHIIFYNVE
ncbi:GNAT family N-acetyltransferase [Clostridium sp. P21]|uniref:GNAT family N-acetyltransferase n=1 Tax=Clostridium muellerianum TaxID=2716538 RepID=A0A7Y0EII6_9CLOT|nr:GNAT family protein [Clostridium muellerianum]NMM64108.1 GNAT family N-acetyltransferase [Clostridium muellerianum]